MTDSYIISKMNEYAFSGNTGIVWADRGIWSAE